MNDRHSNYTYCPSVFEYSRLVTREVKVGSIRIGGSNPIRIQSMTTTDTMDTIKTVEQSIRMIKAGCELVRITAPSINEAKNLENIKKELRKRGYTTPLCADIHFTPNAAESAARIVEKVRINPGNYADRKKFEHIEYTDQSYRDELERIRERFLPLVRICKEHGTAMRIGTNHGSLSDRILSRYGDTPLGMVESAIEFLEICEAEKYYDIVLSMKASNPQVMVQAYRLLVHKLMARAVQPPPFGGKEGGIYPLHLGVTEAGEGEDGRIKSAVGIGTLLEDGLGDTVRVSLTEEPEFEIPVARELVSRYAARSGHGMEGKETNIISGWNPFEYQKRSSETVKNIGGHNVPRVVADLSGMRSDGPLKPSALFGAGYQYSVPSDKWNITDQACDYVYLGTQEASFEIPGTLGLIYDAAIYEKRIHKNSRKGVERIYPLFNGHEYFRSAVRSNELNFILVDPSTLLHPEFRLKELDKTIVLVFETDCVNAMQDLRARFLAMKSAVPVIIKRSYPGLSEEQFQLYASTDLGGLLLDGFGDGVWIGKPDGIPLQSVNSTVFGVLQATRTRISKTEYISCPSCGRTLFDLQETTAKIRSRTSHLKGVKIGIMGCIVNGPGEMADADYGYVGTGIGKITLYKGQEVVKKNIPSETAVDELITLIRTHGDWVDPS